MLNLNLPGKQLKIKKYRYKIYILSQVSIPKNTITAQRIELSRTVTYSVHVYNLLQLYHACDIELDASHNICVFDYELLFYSDYFTTMMALLATICSVSRVNADLRYMVFVVVSFLTAFNVRSVYIV